MTWQDYDTWEELIESIKKDWKQEASQT